MDSLAPQLVAMLLSFFGSIVVSLMIVMVFTICCCDTGIQLGDGLPGAFDDSEQFLQEETDALELMDDASRQSYLTAKRFIERNPPNSANTDISLSQFLTIQEKAVAAWEFQFDMLQQRCLVQDRTEIEFMDATTSVQTNLPLPKQNEVYYWEAKVYSMAPHVKVSVGLSTKPYPLFRLPGMHRYSVAYESSGIRRLNQPFGAPKYGRPWTTGDVIGVGYRPRSGTVFFTHNGKKLPDVVHGLRVNVFPTIGATGPATVVANLGQSGFVFIEANVRKWGLAPATGTLQPPPPYGNQDDSVLLEFTRVRAGASTEHNSSTPSSPEFPPPYDPTGDHAHESSDGDHGDHSDHSDHSDHDTDSNEPESNETEHGSGATEANEPARDDAGSDASSGSSGSSPGEAGPSQEHD